MKLHVLDGYIQTMYLVEYEHGLLLLDGGCVVDVKPVFDFIRVQLQRPIRDLKTVVVSHMHPDHAGGAHRFRKLTGCAIVTGQSDKRWYAGWQGRLMYLTDILLTLYVAGKRGKPRASLWFPRILKADHELADGQTVPNFPEWQIVTTPGHTNCDISLFHPASQQIYLADVVVKLRDRFIPPFPLFHPNRFKASIEKLKQLPVKTLLLAHGGLIELSNHPQALNVHTPKLPRTHWRAFKLRLKQHLQRS